MITFKELIKNTSIADIPLTHQHNLEELLKRINKVRAAYNKPMTVTSGYRSMYDHKRIYSQKGITDESKIPMQSKHLYGQAVDIADADGSMKKWVLENVKLLEDVGLWCEDFAYTKTWIHFQILPPKSGKRFFIP